MAYTDVQMPTSNVLASLYSTLRGGQDALTQHTRLALRSAACVILQNRNRHTSRRGLRWGCGAKGLNKTIYGLPPRQPQSRPPFPQGGRPCHLAFLILIYGLGKACEHVTQSALDTSISDL